MRKYFPGTDTGYHGVPSARLVDAVVSDAYLQAFFELLLPHFADLER